MGSNHNGTTRQWKTIQSYKKDKRTSIAETKLFRSKEEAIKQFEEGLQ